MIALSHNHNSCHDLTCGDNTDHPSRDKTHRRHNRANAESMQEQNSVRLNSTGACGDGAPASFRSADTAPPFPVRLHQMLCSAQRNGFDDVVSWQPDGRCFRVHQPTRFVNDILPCWFNHSKIRSFQRQLNIYGFTRVKSGNDRGGYYHEKFLRDSKEQCIFITRWKNNNKRTVQKAKRMLQQPIRARNSNDGAEHSETNYDFIINQGDKLDNNCDTKLRPRQALTGSSRITSPVSIARSPKTVVLCEDTEQQQKHHHQQHQQQDHHPDEEFLIYNIFDHPCHLLLDYHDEGAVENASDRYGDHDSRCDVLDFEGRFFHYLECNSLDDSAATWDDDLFL